MFSNKQPPIETNNEDATINMVMAMITRNKVPMTMAFKEKEPYKAKSTQDWKEENLQKSFEATIKEIQDKKPPMSLPCSAIETRTSKTRMEPINFSKSIRSTNVDLLVKALKDQLLESKHSITLAQFFSVGSRL